MHKIIISDATLSGELFSATEKKKSLKFKDNYYIYLLPVDRSQTKNFGIEKLLKINNVLSNVNTEHYNNSKLRIYDL